MANINRGFCLFSAVLLIACQEKEELGGDEGRGAGLPSSKETQIGSVDPVDESFEEWVSKVKATEPSSKERGMVLFKMAKDKALPAYRTLKFIVDHKEKDESLIGCSVGIMSRVRKSDPIEALRCYELIRDVPQLKGSLHSIGTELGRQAPVHGLDWLNSQDNSREVYFASVNLGGGFSEYAACHPPEEVEPIFERYLESPLFDGKAYDTNGKGEGTRMRERMTDGVLEALARNGDLSAERCSRLMLKVPEKCVPHLESFKVYGWPYDRILNEFDRDDFSDESRDSATFIGLERLMENYSLEKTLEWIDRIKDPRIVRLTTSNAFHHFLLQAEHDVFIDILEGIEKPEHFQEAIKWAKVKARDTRNQGMKEWVEELEKRRR